MSLNKSLAGLWLALLLALALASGVSAQGGSGVTPMPPIDLPPFPEPSFPLPPIGGPISIELHSVDAVVDGPVATVKVRQVFRNESDAQVEGTFIFPLPPDAAISDFRMTVDGQVLEGKVLKKDEARRIYEDIVRSQRDPALLEYLERDLFQTNVFPIPPHASRTLDFTYSQVLPQTDGLYHFRYPLRTRQYGATPVQTLALRVELRNQPGLRTVYSPSHDVSVQRSGDDSALVGYEATNVQPERDFDLYYGVSKEAIGLNLLSYKPAGEDGFFLLLAAPSIDVAPDAIVRRDVILVMDISGSMEGAKIEQAKQAARYVVEHLNAGDRFNLVAFSTGASLWAETLQSQGADKTAKAEAWIDDLQAEGSTDINRALLEALGQLQTRGGDDRSRPAYILFLTDGLPTQGEIDPDRIIKNALNNLPSDQSARLFTFGVGYDVDAVLLDSLGKEMGGRSTYVKPDESIDEAVGSFYSQVSTPVLSGVRIELPGVRTEDTYPFPLPDLFAGEQLVLAGRYRQGGDTTVSLTGNVNGEKRTFTYPGQRLVQAGGEPLVARLWATRKIGSLLEQIRRQGADPELVDAVVKLSTAYGIMTPYTSYLVLEPTNLPVLRQGTGGQPMATQAPAAAPMEALPRLSLDALNAAPASGEKAVAASEVQQEMLGADRATEEQGVRFAGGKTFAFQQQLNGADGRTYELWVDADYKTAMSLETVIFGSDDYFDLAAQPEAAPWLAVSPELVVVIDGKAYRTTVTGADDQPTTTDDRPPTAAPAATPMLTATPAASPSPAVPSSPAPTLWDAILAWLKAIMDQPSQP